MRNGLNILSLGCSVGSLVWSVIALLRLRRFRRLRAERDRALFEQGAICGALAARQRPDFDAFECIPVASEIRDLAVKKVGKDAK